jgi:hypothetical protein
MHCHDEEGSDQTQCALFRSPKGACHTDDCVPPEIADAWALSKTNWPAAPVQVIDAQTLHPIAFAKFVLAGRYRLLSSCIVFSDVLVISGTLRI